MSFRTMLKILIIFIVIISVQCAPSPQNDDVEVQDQSSGGINEAEYDYKFLLDDGHERSQQRKEVDGVNVVIGFYKYIDPDGKERQIYYKADDKGYQISYDKPFNFPTNNDLESSRLSSSYLPPSQNLIKDVLATPSKDYLPPRNTYLPPN